MKKLGRKGFTLIELLAVIVVLAVIMVIATQQVNKTIKKSRARSYMDSALSIQKAAKTYCAEKTTIAGFDTDNAKEYVEANGIKIEVVGNDVKLTLDGTNSKYNNFDKAELKGLETSSIKVVGADANNVTGELTIVNPCD